MSTILYVKDLTENIRYFDKSICPNCHMKLESSPLRKTKCPHCKEYIYSKTHAMCHKKMLLSEADAKESEKYYILFNHLKTSENPMIDEHFLKLLLTDLNISSEKYKVLRLKNPKLSDVNLLIQLNKKASKEYLKKKIGQVNDFHLGLYRNCLLDIGRLYSLNSNFKESLDFINQVIYLDVNGVENNMKSLDLHTAEEGECVPKVVLMAISANLYLQNKVTLKNIESNFKSQTVNKKLKYVFTLDEAWNLIEKNFDEKMSNFFD